LSVPLNSYDIGEAHVVDASGPQMRARKERRRMDIAEILFPGGVDPNEILIDGGF
jgi:hypothetical protein